MAITFDKNKVWFTLTDERGNTATVFDMGWCWIVDENNTNLTEDEIISSIETFLQQ